MNPYLSQDLAFFQEMNRRKPVKQPEKLISSWIHKRRVMPPGSAYPGVYDINRGPYVIELCDNMAPYSRVKYQALKKGVQIFGTTIGENVIAYGIGGRPIKQLYISATDELLQMFSTDKLDPLIDSCGLRHLISDQSESYHTRKTGDKTKYKQYPGGALALTSAQSAPLMRSTPYQYVILDEIDGAPAQLKTGEGNFISVAEGRIETYGERGKMFFLSTPTLYGDSLIDIQYDKGDKRKFMVQCPLCGKYQWLSMGKENSNYGLKGDYKAGTLIQGYYLCFHCHDAIFDHHKGFLLASGHWEPTAIPKDKYFRSYHLPSFYSPPGMTTFTKMRAKYDEAQELGDDGMRSFTNLYLGKSFRPSGEKPKFESVIEIRSKGHKSGEVPKDILFLTMAADVQRGQQKYADYTNEEILELAEKFKKDRDDKKLEGLPRVEAEVCGHGWDFRTASIIYKHFYGHIDDETAGAWQEFTNWIEETGLRFQRKDGYSFDLKRIFIDCGDGMFDSTVVSYCSKWPGTYPTKGRTPLKQDRMKTGTIDEMSKMDFIRYKASETGKNDLILVVVNYYKRHIYQNLKNKPDQQTGEQPPNSHITPDDYPDSYFKGLTAETQDRKGNFHNLANRRNEPLDILVLNKCAADHVVDGWIEQKRWQLKERYKKARKPVPTKDQLKKVWNRQTVTALYEKELRQKGW